MTNNKHSFIHRLIHTKPLHNWLFRHHYLTSTVFDGAQIEFCHPKALAKKIDPKAGSMNIRIDNFIYSVNVDHQRLLVEAMNKPKNLQELASAILKFQNEHPGVMHAWRVHRDGTLVQTN